MRNKNKSKNTFLLPLPSSQAELHSQLLYLLLLSSSGAWRMGVAVSSSFFVSAAFSSSHPSMGSFPQETILHKLLQYGSFPWAAVLHKLPLHGSFTQGTVLQKWTAPAWVPCGVTGPTGKPTPSWALHGVTSSCGAHPSALAQDLLWGAGWIFDPLSSSMGCKWHNLHHHGLHHELF